MKKKTNVKSFDKDLEQGTVKKKKKSTVWESLGIGRFWQGYGSK